MNRRRFAQAVASLALAGCKRDEPRAGEFTLAAAASLRSVLPALSRAFEAGNAVPGVDPPPPMTRPATHVVATYGASGDLRKQVEGGAPVDGVIFAAARPVDDLIASGHAERASRVVLATNALVLVGPRGGKPVTFATLDALPEGERIAVGDPGAVPAGDYARTWLRSLGKWDALQGRLVLGGDVAAVLAYARRGEVAAAIVYRTDARGVDSVVVLDEARGPGAPRTEVVGAVVRGARGAVQAGAFLGFAGSAEGRRTFADFGFGPP